MTERETVRSTPELVTRPGDWGRDLYVTERRVELVATNKWERAASLDSPGWTDCADVAWRYPAGWATIVEYRVLLRIGTTLHLYAQALFPVAGPNVLALGTELSALLVKIRGIPHDGVIVETRLGFLAAASGVATVHVANWARSPAEMSVGQINVDVPQPLVVTGTVGIAPQPLEVFGLVEVQEPITVQGTVAIDPQPIEVFGTVSLTPYPVKVFGTIDCIPPIVLFDAWGSLLPSKVPRIGPALLQGFNVHNPGALAYLFVFDAAAVPALGTPSYLVPIELPANDNIAINLPNIQFNSGIAWAVSTSDATLVNPAGPAQRTARVDTFWRIP